MSLPNKASNLPANAAAGAGPSAPVVAHNDTTGGGPSWIPPWNHPTVTPTPINPFIPPQQPHVPYVPDVITTDGTDIRIGALGPMTLTDKLLYALGIVIFAHPTPPEKCSSCEQEREIVIAYGRTIHRKICKVCATKVLDKVLGAKVDAELESILYEKTDTK